jgi:hypothetical protein
MPTLRSSQTIRITTSTNPHRWGGPNWVRFNILRGLHRQQVPLVLVGDFVIAHNSANNPAIGSTFEARRYLRYMVERGEIAIEGYAYVRRERAQRAPIAFAAASGTGEFTFGVELEFHCRAELEIVEKLRAAGIDCRRESLSHDVRTWWKLTTDGSLGNYSTGRELVSPKLQGAAGLRDLEKVCRILSELRCTINGRCGFHVHVGHEGHSDNVAYHQRLLNIYADNEAALDSIMSPSRRGPNGGNGFAGSVRRPTRSDSVEQLCRSVGCTGNRSYARYRKLNVDSWWSYKTVEFRHHHGSVDADKVCNWVQFCLQLCLLATTDRQVPGVQTIGQLMVAMDLAPELQQFFNDRAARYAANQVRRAA